MAEWKECTIKDLGEVVGGATPSTKDPQNYEDGDIPWITPKDLSILSGRHISKGERCITQKGLKSCSAQMMPKHSVLFSSRAPIGYVAISTCPVCTNQGFKSIVPNRNADYLFLYYLLKYKKDDIENMGSGTTFKEVSGSTMRSIKVIVPKEKDVQVAIGRVLGSIDDKIEENERINHNLQQQGIAIVENYLTNTENEILLGDIMSFDNGFAFQSNTYQQNGTYRVITIKNVQDGYIDSSDASYVLCIPHKMKSCCVLHEGDALLSLTGNVGRVGIVYEPNLLLNQRVAKVVPYEKSLQGFVYFLLRHSSMKSRMETIAKGTAQQNLSPVETLKLSITFQFDTVSAITNQLNAFYEQLVALFIENKQLAALRDTLLPKLMSGEIDVSEIEI